MRFKAVSFPGWPKLPSAYPPVGLIRPGDAVVDMPKARIELDGNLHKALSIQATKANMSLKQYVTTLLLPAVGAATWEFLGFEPSDEGQKSVIGETSAKAIKPKSGKGQLARNAEALEEIKRLWSEGERDRKVISTKIGYPYSTTGEHIRKMLASGELQEVEGEGEES
jgi:hypothetical protein